MATIGDRFKEIRKERGLTQAAFGEMMGVSHSHISKIEANKESPSDTLIKLVCLDFSINENWLRTGEGSKSMDVHFENISTPDLFETLKKLQFNVNQKYSVDLELANSINLLIEILGEEEITSGRRLLYENSIHALLTYLHHFLKSSQNCINETPKKDQQEMNTQIYDLFSQTREGINRCLDTIYGILVDAIRTEK
ncbi:helix-turn-helix domain-containing protein [Paenibacillus sp. PDC88]|uniref:helix-turn-helix domain-containing protein n=1 Tax=Paenibacillus TaxID=44249 RepID=UPI0008993BE3|nr:helix-turn-helix transcriptional regulator [Paenibacillus sp. PDC88]SDX82827.1 Transcriptional regulator, contains XRE-family HTH domain [Paenibacillus sp. PDC88]